ncbi:NtaA/DmoA family FMN-dependent monooxygenase [Pseudonocardia sp. NPDC049635]|uniref:NtaA/DmoA family FMN-dependent monooxygenase n=1 Tax=Pseudonocardia sp. NPDC049635 TaxID=3155506 RepID=UPI00340328F0
MFHMGWFVGMGFGVYGWNQRWSGNSARDVANPKLFIDIATSLERAGFDYMMLEDSSVIPDVYQGSREHALKNGTMRLDPMPLVPLLAAHTRHLGIVATAATTFYPPYLAARLMVTLDHLTEGRVGVNLVTASPHAAAQNYGFEKHVEHDKRYVMADEWIRCVKALWDTWEPGAVVMDEVTGVFADHTKVHTADFQGEYYSSRGPLNSMPGPQGHPVICQAGGSPAGRNFGAAHADTIIASLAENPGVENLKEYHQDMKARLVAHGRKPDDAKVLFLIHPILGDSMEEARAKQKAMQEATAANIEGLLAGMSYYSGLDFSQFELDAPLPDLSGLHNGHQSLVDDFVKRAEGKTLREALQARSQTVGSIELVGTPDSVASQMGELADEIDGDGYLVRIPPTRKALTEVCDGLAPVLRKRGMIRSGYSYDTFKENLLEF